MERRAISGTFGYGLLEAAWTHLSYTLCLKRTTSPWHTSPAGVKAEKGRRNGRERQEHIKLGLRERSQGWDQAQGDALYVQVGRVDPTDCELLTFAADGEGPSWEPPECDSEIGKPECTDEGAQRPHQHASLNRLSWQRTLVKVAASLLGSTVVERTQLAILTGMAVLRGGMRLTLCAP